MRTKRAFTFVELVITAAIVAILAAIAIPNFLEAKVRAVVSRSKAELGMLKMGIESYRLDHRAYPPNAETGKSNPADLVVLTTPVSYLYRLPHDAFTIRETHRGSREEIIPEAYRYVNGFQLNPDEGLTVPKGPLDQRGAIAAFLWGYGPTSDRSDPLLSSETLTLLPEDGATTGGRVRLHYYDPSNGTVSWGNIYQRLP